MYEKLLIDTQFKRTPEFIPVRKTKRMFTQMAGKILYKVDKHEKCSAIQSHDFSSNICKEEPELDTQKEVVLDVRLNTVGRQFKRLNDDINETPLIRSTNTSRAFFSRKVSQVHQNNQPKDETENETIINKSTFLKNMKVLPFTKFPIILETNLKEKIGTLNENKILSTQSKILREESPMYYEYSDKLKTATGFPLPNPIKDPRYLKIKHYQDILESSKNEIKLKSISCIQSDKLMFEPQESRRSNHNCKKETYKKLRKKTMTNRRQFLFYSSQGLKMSDCADPVDQITTFINFMPTKHEN